MKETICRFGPNDSLLGILTRPDEDELVKDAPVALILNAGIVHRVGQFRLHVTMARQLAKQGYLTLRIDLSGLGDSPPRTDRSDSDNRAERDVRDAMDHLEQTIGAESFVLIGLCSGAYNAHKVSIKEDRVTGAVFLDGLVFQTSGYVRRHKIGRLFRYRFWRNAIKRRLSGKMPDHSESAANQLAASEFFDTGMSRESVRSDLQTLLDRNVQMLFIYTEGYDDICGRAQFYEMYGFRPSDQQQVEYYANAEHTYPIVENREIACGRIATWFADRFPRVAENRRILQNSSL